MITEAVGTTVLEWVPLLSTAGLGVLVALNGRKTATTQDWDSLVDQLLATVASLSARLAAETAEAAKSKNNERTVSARLEGTESRLRQAIRVIRLAIAHIDDIRGVVDKGRGPIPAMPPELIEWQQKESKSHPPKADRA